MRKTRASNKGCLLMKFTDYQVLIDWTGRQLRADKRGAIPAHVAPILERLHVGGESWLKMMVKFHRLFKSRAESRLQAMQQEREACATQSIHGIRNSRDDLSCDGKRPVEGVTARVRSPPRNATTDTVR